MSTNVTSAASVRRRATARSDGEPTAGRSKQKEVRDPREYLDNLSLARKEGWRDMVNAAPRMSPELLSVKAIRQLGGDALEEYNDARLRWHADMGTIITAQCRLVLEQLQEAVTANCPTGADSKPMLALSGLPGLGKSTVVRVFGAQFHQLQIAKFGQYTQSGDERWPVCRVGLTGATGVLDFMAALCLFYAHPGVKIARELENHALDCVSSCGTHLLIVDNLHFLHGRYRQMEELSNQFKHIADDFGVTVLFIGIGLHERHALLDDNGRYEDHQMEQLLRACIPVDMSPFNIDTKIGRLEWHHLLRTIEQQIVLARKYPGMLAEDLSDYLFIRSTGHIGSLMSLLRLGCHRAIRTGAEALTVELLDKCRIDSAAELGRRELEVAFRTGKKTTRTSGS